MSNGPMSCDSCNKSCEKNTKELPLISSGFLILSERCNLACKYCFVKQNAQEMTYQIALDAVKFLIQNAEASNQEPSINFFGGEPLLKYKEIIVPITNYIRQEYKKPFSIGMTTNGVLLDKEKIDFIKANQIGVLFSIDGDKATQDFNRPFHDGRGSFDVIEPVIKSILEIDQNATFRATIDHRTAQHTYENMRFADAKGYNNMFFIPNVFAKWSQEQIQILREQIHLFGDWFIEEARKGRFIQFNPFTEKLYEISRINEAHTKKQHRLSNQMPGEGKCGLGATRFASIGTDGTVYGCQEMTSNSNQDDTFVIGNIYTGIDNEKRRALAARFNKQIIKGKNCDDCLLNSICDGGCVANNYLISKDVNQMPEMLCEWYQMLLEEAIRVSRILGEEHNVAFRNKYFS